MDTESPPRRPRARGAIEMEQMAAMRFFDANVAVGPRKVIFKDHLWEAAEVFQRLEECGIGESLVYHTTSVEDNPLYGNARLLQEIRDVPNAHPVWAMLPFTTNELGGRESVRAELKEHGIKAVLVYPAAHVYSNAEWCCGDLYEMLERMRMPVFVRLDPADFTWNELAQLLSNHPKLPLIARNVGYTIDRSAYRLLERHESFHIETAKYLVYRGIEEIVRLFGAERLIFGSETPYLSPGAAITPILTAAISGKDREKIARGNITRLLESIDYDG